MGALFQWGQALPGLRRLPLTLAYQEGSAKTLVAIDAAEDLVAVLVVAQEHCVEWTKTAQAGPVPFVVSINVSGEPGYPRGLHVSMSAGGAQTNSPWGPPPVPDKPLVLDAPRKARTGQVFRLAVLCTEPAVELGAMFLVRGDVRFRRGRIWHARTELLSEGDREWFSILSHGRTGWLR